MKSIVTVVGGSNSAHTLIPLLSHANHKVQLLTRKPNLWTENIVMEYQNPKGEIIKKLEGKISKCSANPEELIPDSDIIILSLPVSSYRAVLHQIAPYIKKNKKTIIFTVYGQAGFNWMVEEIKTKFNLNQIITVASGLIPWITRTKEYGKIGINYGPKKVNVAAVFPSSEFNYVNDMLLNDLCFKWFNTGAYKQAENFISLTLSVDNQIIHQTRLYGLFKVSGGFWNSKEEVPLFYADYDDLSSDYLKFLDDEYSLIREKIIRLYPNKKFTYMLNYLDLERLSYGSANTDIKSSFKNSQTLVLIPTPVVCKEDGKWYINTNHRFFYDDIYYGICIAKWIAEKLNIPTPFIDELLNWAQMMLNDSIIKGNKLILPPSTNFKHGLPSEYGKKDINDLVD